MAYQRTYRCPPLPIPRNEHVDDAVVVWLAREALERTATGDGLVLTTFTDLGEVDPTDIPPKVDQQLGRPATDFVWRRFGGLGVRA